MTLEQLSRIYFLATARISEGSAELYEAVHDEKGSPILDQKQLSEITNKYSRSFRIELDLMRAALNEYNEQHG
jgi:hypothetical protein